MVLVVVKLCKLLQWSGSKGRSARGRVKYHVVGLGTGVSGSGITDSGCKCIQREVRDRV
jgi:hypothetical protein